MLLRVVVNLSLFSAAFLNAGGAHLRLLLPPPPGNRDDEGAEEEDKEEQQESHLILCLFGAKKSTEEV